MTARLNDQEFVKASEFTFRHFDKSGSGFMEKKEFFELVGAVAPKLNFPITQQLLEYTFDRTDTDNDGRISLQEFHNTLRGFYFS